MSYYLWDKSFSGVKGQYVNILFWQIIAAKESTSDSWSALIKGFIQSSENTEHDHEK